MPEQNVNIRNKKASHEYEFLEKLIAGIQLTGTEIKSIKLGKASLTDPYCYFHNGELFLKGMQVSEYWWGSYNNHEPKRDRKLLLHKKELQKLERKSQEKGLTIVATRLFVNEKGLAKIEIALARGKQDFDKRQDIKSRDHKREMDRAMKR
ncbi:MAG: SsrA-binding protein SmpB [Bacteroidota bacterium]|nr:SsrA-binding protein SmpB [Bacteroidota bacterium]